MTTDVAYLQRNLLKKVVEKTRAYSCISCRYRLYIEDVTIAIGI